MFWFQILVVVIVVASLLLARYLLKNKNIDKYLPYIISGILAVVFFFRYMLADDRFETIFALNNSPISSGVLTVISLLLNTCLYAVILLVVLYPFFVNSKLIVLLKYFGGVVSVFCLGFLYFVTIGIVGESAYIGLNIRSILMAMELGLVVSSVIIVWMRDRGFALTKQDGKILYCIPVIFLVTMPGYFFQVLFGRANYAVKILDFEFPHRVILYLAILIPIVIFVILRNFDKKTIKGVLLYISLGALITFSLRFKFEELFDVTNLPFHLCNTAMYIIPLCLIFKLKKLFYFTYFINVFGAFIAMVLPNYSSGANLFSVGLVVFYVNHYIAFFMPILMVALRLYDRPKLREFKYSIIGFAMYYLLVVVVNAWFSNYGSVDYFFINSDFVASKLGEWAENLRDVVWDFNLFGLRFVLYPLYQFLYFLVYTVLSVAVWFMYELLYVSVDNVIDIVNENKKIQLDKLAIESEIKGSIDMKPMYPMDKDKVVLKNFSKKYGDKFAVENIDLTVSAGEVFGFLGHNGAGKSTVIKSIVGIQPITSGQISVCGYDVEKQSVLAKSQIGFVPDHYALYEKLSGREYINYIADLYNVSKSDRDKRIKKYVELFELQSAINNPIKTYSHGMKQKITIMSALVHNPKVWILDEPLTGLDPVSIFQVKECLKDHARQGNIVFFSSHLIDIVEQLCDRVAILKKGKLLSCMKVDDIKKESSLEEFYIRHTHKSKFVAKEKIAGEKV